MSDTTTQPLVKPSERPYFVHRSWRRYMGQGGRPANKLRPYHSRFEAVSLIYNDWTGKQTDIIRLARELNWTPADVREFISELRADGVFDLVHPERGAVE